MTDRTPAPPPRANEGLEAIMSRRLTPEELLQAKTWINEKAYRKGDPCQVCESPLSEIQSTLANVPGGVSPIDLESGWIYPSVVTLCTNCGYTRYFNAIIMGLVPRYQAPSGGNDG